MTQSLRLADNTMARPQKPGDAAANASASAIRGRLIALAVKLVWNRDDAEEIVQEAFTIAVAKGPAFDTPPYEAWMMRTVGNLCLNRRRRRRPEQIADWIDIPSDDQPHAQIERNERLESLRRAMATLPDQQRLAVVLRMMEHATYEKVAEVLGVSVSAARTHVHLGRQRLAETLTQNGVIDERGKI